MKRLEFSPLALQLIFILKDKKLGRRTLTSRIGSSESEVRTTLDKLRNKQFVKMDRSGTELTAKGQDYFYPLLDSIEKIANLELRELAVDEFNKGALLNSISLEEKTWFYRDLAVREGATGAILISCEGELSFLNTGENIGEQNPTDEKELIRKFPNWEEGQLIVVTSAPNQKKADIGLWRIVNNLLLNN